MTLVKNTDFDGLYMQDTCLFSLLHCTSHHLKEAIANLSVVPLSVVKEIMSIIDKHTLYSLCADVVNNRLAPHSSAVLGARLDTKLINSVGLQIVNDCLTSWAGLVVPLPVPFTITHCVVSEMA